MSVCPIAVLSLCCWSGGNWALAAVFRVKVGRRISRQQHKAVQLNGIVSTED